MTFEANETHGLRFFAEVTLKGLIILDSEDNVHTAPTVFFYVVDVESLGIVNSGVEEAGFLNGTFLHFFDPTAGDDPIKNEPHCVDAGSGSVNDITRLSDKVQELDRVKCSSSSTYATLGGVL